MALGPELIFAQAVEITREFARGRARRASAGDSWLALSFSRDRILLFSWDSEAYGACHATPDEVRGLEGASASRPPFLDAVRSHIVGADLIAARQINRDRVLELEFRREIGAGFFQARRLIFEACGRYSNIIIADSDGAVVEAAKHIHPDENRYRIIMPGAIYAAPPSIGSVSLDDLDLSDEKCLEKIDDTRGLGKPLIVAVKKMPAPGALAVLREIKNPETPVYQIYPPDGKYLTLAPFTLPGARVLASRGAMTAAREVVLSPLLNRGVSSCRKKISSLLSVAERANERKISEYEALVSGTEEIERLRSEGRLILENAHAIQPRAPFALLTEWTDSGPSEREVALDPARDASGNAEARFAKYRRKKSALEAAAALLLGLYKRRGELAEQRVLLECNDDWNTLAMMASELEKPSKPSGVSGRSKKGTPPTSPYRRAEFPDDCAVIFCGLSAKGNRHVTFKIARADDIWFHTQGTPGAHVILRFDARPSDEAMSRMIGLAASCAVFYSGGRDLGSVKVDYAERKHVRAIQGEGIANVTYKKFRTVTVDSSLWKNFDGRVL